ncbi:MAG: hypothetical protein LBN02_09595 [Oscillospiraceae bacterium]|jgi:hypothetical protein|nr:hypothetical protein [Oscillospiraceae bacterium]
MSTDLEIRYKSAEYMRGIADGMTDVSGEELLRRAEQYRRAAAEFAAVGDYKDAPTRAAECDAIAEEHERREVEKYAVGKKKSRLRRVMEFVVIGVIGAVLLMGFPTIFMLTEETDSTTRALFLGTWGLFVLFALGIGGYAFFSRKRAASKPSKKPPSYKDLKY